MKRNRILTTVVAVVAVLSLLPGCSSTKKPASASTTHPAHHTTSSPGTTTNRTASPLTSTKTTTGPTPGKQSPSERVTIKDFAFHPATLNIKAGTKVTFVNNDSEYHTATSDTTPTVFDSGHITPGDTNGYSVTLTKPGTYHYHCDIHPSMNGTVEVS